MEVELPRVSDNAVVLIYIVTTEVTTDIEAEAVEEFIEYKEEEYAADETGIDVAGAVAVNELEGDELVLDGTKISPLEPVSVEEADNIGSVLVL